VDRPGSANPTAPVSPAEPTPGSGRLTLAMIAGIPVIVILAASWMWYFVVNGQLDLVGSLGTSNRGDLLQPPRQAQDAGWTTPAGESFAPATPPRWTLVIPQRGSVCAADCERRLYETRQIHMALGKAMGRVQRYLVTDAADGALRLEVESLSDQRPVPDDLGAYLATEQRGMTLWKTSEAQFDAMFAEYAEAPDSWYLMDPAGWVMMRYDPAVTYKDVIADLKFLIKNSNG
jgi:hypothetical protein